MRMVHSSLPMSITIGIDASRANVARKTGVEWYAFEVIQRLKTIIPASYRVVLYSREPLRGGMEQLPPSWESRVLRWRPRYLWTQLRLSWEMLRRPPDLLFVPVHVLPIILPKRSVTTVHDVGFIAVPRAYRTAAGRWYLRFSAWFAARFATAILTVSDFSKREIVKYFSADANKIFVTPLAVDHERFRPSDSEEIAPQLARYGVTRPYFLFVGRLEMKKNLDGLFAAFRTFKERRPSNDPTTLVLVGKRGVGGDAALAAVEGTPLQRSVIELGYVDSAAIRHLYAGATAFVFPSWYEGFGLPILEAFACGAPVIASNAGSIPEVAADAAVLIDPADSGAFAIAMERFAADPALRAIYAERGLARVRVYSWERTAKMTWETIEKLAKR